jgi:membrane-associated phospholipid phosphatase
LPIAGPPIFFHPVPGFTLPEELQHLAPAEAYPSAITSGLFFRLMRVIYRIFEAPGAALPSSHVAIAVATVYFSFRYLPRIRYMHLSAALLLCLATVYCHYHYGIDVLTGLLVAAALVPVGNWLYFRFGEEEMQRPKAESRNNAATETRRG